MEKENQIVEFTLDVEHATGFTLSLSNAVAMDLRDKGYGKAEWIIAEFKAYVMDYLKDRGLLFTTVKDALDEAEKVIVEGE